MSLTGPLAPQLSKAVPAKEFLKFPNISIEIRRMIWKRALPGYVMSLYREIEYYISVANFD